MSKKSNKQNKERLFVFRRYKKIEGGKVRRAKHPKLIVDSNKNQYGFMGLTESAKSGHHKNIDLDFNPEKGNKEKSYIRKELRYDDKKHFSNILKNYNLSKKDRVKIEKYLNNKKR